MFKYTVRYKNFNGDEKAKDLLFHLSQSEIMRRELTTEGGYGEYIDGIAKAKNQAELTRAFEDLVLSSYGELSADGESFVKNDEAGNPLVNKFKNTAAYDQLFVDLLTNEELPAKFVNGLMPADLMAQVAAMKENTEVIPSATANLT